MQATAKLFNLVSNSISFLLFAGLFLIAAFSLISLSPVSFEDYTAYKDGLDNYYARQDTPVDGQVAGVADPAPYSQIEVKNLLEKKGQSYRFASEGMHAELYADIKSQNDLELIEIKNTSAQTKELELLVAYSTDDEVSYELYSKNYVLDEIEEDRFIVSLRPDTSAVISLKRVGDSALLTGDYSFSLVLDEFRLVQLP